MSENNEHSPDDTETETKTMEDLPNNLSKSEAKLINQADTAMIEDEEMPTYISISSTSKPDDSDVVNTKQLENVSQEVEEKCSPSPAPSDDQAPSSVYVLSSGDDTDQHFYNDVDDEDEDGDSEDMGNLELDNEFDPEHPNDMKHLMDEEDDDEDDEDEEDDEESHRQLNSDEYESHRQLNNDEYDIDSNHEIEDTKSDDFVLNRRLKNHDKEKNLSLQDLSAYENNMDTGYQKRRHSLNLRSNYVNISPTMMYSMVHRKQQPPAKYQHVQSQVKLYIKDRKEQNRRSAMEKHAKQYREDTIHNKNNTEKNNDTENTKLTSTNKTIKDYAERTIKELEIAEVCGRDKINYNASQIVLNGQNNRNGLESIQEELIQNEIQINIHYDSTQNEKDPLIIDDKMQKQNGTVEVKQLKFNFPEREASHLGDAMQSSLIQNNHQEVPPVLYNLRTLSYEEYIRGTSDSSQKADLNKNAHVEQEHLQSEIYNNAEPMDVSIDNNDSTCPLRIENIKSIRTMADETKNNNEQIIFDKVNEELNKTTSEVIALKNKLNKKTVQYNNLLDAYQKQLTENLKMKGELDELRKSIAKYEKENKSPEQKAASIQTDIITNSVSNRHNQAEPTQKQPNNKISSNSVASTLSSIEQWSDSTCNLSISMKPPEVTKALHSDDSIVLTDDTPGKTTRSLSRAFITSSRILQTLSNITQGKAKPESPLVQNSKKRLNENSTTELQNDDVGCQSLPSSSKKRKITDVLRPSNFLQSSKTSQIDVESHSKLNETSNVESQFKYSRESVSDKVESQENSSTANTSQLGATASTAENKTENTDDPEDSVKCFVYHENENSKDRSFLILAEEPKKDKTPNEAGHIRECGPFLLGNVEVRMSEINGTINIWGKEISQDSIAEIENEIDINTKVKDGKKYHCWTKTAHTRFNGSNLACSTSKKSKVPPKFELSPVASNFSCTQSPSFYTAKPSCSTDKANTDNLYSPNVCISSCEDCDSSKHRKEWLKYKRINPQEKSYSYCIHNVNTLEEKCNCSLHKEKQKFEDNFNCNKDKSSSKEHRRSFSRNLEPNKHLHDNIANSAVVDSEPTCRYHTACHHSLHDPGENCQESHKYCNILKETCACEPIIMNTNRECSESCNHPSPNIHNDEEPLITLEQCSETLETRRRRHTGKRVRGILMDLLRGCGDCYNSSTSNTSKGCIHKKETHLTNCSPQFKVSPCASPQPSCSNAAQPTSRCCHAYAQRIESQLEEFRVEMEKVRSRSDAILNMLNMLHSMDTN